MLDTLTRTTQNVIPFSAEKNGEIITADGTVRWFKNDKLHRLGAPAITRPDGTLEWWLSGKRHRDEGPAIVFADGTQQWWLDGVLFLHVPAAKNA